MSGAFAMPYSLSGGAGYKTNPTYDEKLREKSAFYRKHSVASKEQENDRRASSISAEDAAAATAAAGGARRGSVAAAMATRKGSVQIDSSATRKDSIFGMEPTAGRQYSEDRRPSTSLASDLFHKMKGDRKSSSGSQGGARA